MAAWDTLQKQRTKAQHIIHTAQVCYPLHHSRSARTSKPVPTPSLNLYIYSHLMSIAHRRPQGCQHVLYVLPAIFYLACPIHVAMVHFLSPAIPSSMLQIWFRVVMHPFKAHTPFCDSFWGSDILCSAAQKEQSAHSFQAPLPCCICSCPCCETPPSTISCISCQVTNIDMQASICSQDTKYRCFAGSCQEAESSTSHPGGHSQGCSCTGSCSGSC